jgi:hypothetical protein
MRKLLVWATASPWRVARTVVVAVACLTLVAGCVGETGYSQLERAARSTDALPSAISHELATTLVTPSARLAATHDGITYYLAKGTKNSGVCIVIARTNTDWVASCGLAGLTVDLGDISARLLADTQETPAHWTRVGKNLAIED